MRTLISALTLLALTLSLSACPDGENGQVIEEPISYGDYHIANQTTVAVTIEATELFTDDPIALLTDTVQPDATEYIYTFAEGSGGHVMPSNAFSAFRVLATIDSQPVTVYDAVDDGRWPTTGSTEDGHQILTFTVTEDDIAQAQQP